MRYRLCILRCPDLRKYAPASVLPKRTEKEPTPKWKRPLEVHPGKTPKRGGADAASATPEGDLEKMSIEELEAALNEIQQ